jgi:DNA-directed RNA polymerase specialized sigma24 family protein
MAPLLERRPHTGATMSGHAGSCIVGAFSGESYLAQVLHQATRQRLGPQEIEPVPATKPPPSITELATGCRREGTRFRRGEPCSTDFALELFRRAICERDELAWEALVVEYRQLVRTWVRQPPAIDDLSEDDLVNGTFARFWSAVKPERWHEFASLPAVLHYLKLCARSLVLDNVRAKRHARTVSLDCLPDVAMSVGEEGSIAELSANELWKEVRGALPDEREQLLAYLSMVCEMKPAEIRARHPTRFTSVAEVYRMKRNVVERLRRNPAILRARTA